MGKTEQLSPRCRKLYIGDFPHMVLSQNEKCSSLSSSSDSCCRFVANVIKYTNALKCHDLTAQDVGKVYSQINKPYSTPLACVVYRRLMTALIMHSCLNF